MKGFKDNNFNDRLGTASSARQAALKKFQERPKADDPVMQQKAEERRKLAEAREARISGRAAAKAEEEARLAAEKIAKEESDRVEKAARQERDAAEQERLEIERKAARDARYAARKARRA